MVPRILRQQFKANYANGLWDLHKVQARVAKMADSAASDQTKGAPVETATDDENFGVDSFNTVNHHYPVIYPPKSNIGCWISAAIIATLLTLAMLLAIAGGAWWLLSQRAPSPVVPPPPPVNSTLDLNADFFVP